MVVTIKKIEKLTFRGVLLMYNDLKVTYPRRAFFVYHSWSNWKVLVFEEMGKPE